MSNPRTLFEEIELLPRDIRHLLFSWLDNKTLGRFSVASKKSHFFCEEDEVWGERLRRVFNAECGDEKPKVVYKRLVSQYAEYGAGLKQIFCYSMTYKKNDLLRAVTLLAAMKSFNKAIENKTWHPLKNDDLLALALKHGASKEEFDKMSELVDVFTSEQLFSADARWHLMKGAGRENNLTILTQSMALSTATQDEFAKTVSDNPDMTADDKAMWTNMQRVGSVFLFATGFFLQRGYVAALKTFLDRIDRNVFPVLKFTHPLGIDFIYGEEIFKRALGNISLASKSLLFADSSEPSPELIEYLIARKATCVQAKDENLATFRLKVGTVGDNNVVYYNPLWMVIDSIREIDPNKMTMEKAVDAAQRLEEIALMLIENGEDINHIFMPRDDHEKGYTPAKAAQTWLNAHRRESLSALDEERKRIFEKLLAYRPAPKVYVDPDQYYRELEEAKAMAFGI